MKAGDNQHKAGAANLRDHAPIAQSKAAQMLNVGERSLSSARRVITEGSPELVQAVECGAGECVGGGLRFTQIQFFVGQSLAATHD